MRTSVIPSFTTYNTNKDQIMEALQEATGGKIVVLTTHGVPDYAHSWVTLSPTLFEEYFKYMKAHRYRVIAMRDLTRYIDPIEARGLTAAVVEGAREVASAPSPNKEIY